MDFDLSIGIHNQTITLGTVIDVSRLVGVLHD